MVRILAQAADMMKEMYRGERREEKSNEKLTTVCIRSSLVDPNFETSLRWESKRISESGGGGGGDYRKYYLCSMPQHYW